MSARLLVGGAVAVSVALVVIYLTAGGGSYEPTPVADPCQPRAWTDPGDLEEAAQQFFLSALDGAACELGVSREELAAGLATDETRREFATEQGIADAELEAAVRAGVVRAIDDAEAAGTVPALVADGLRAAAARLPVDEAIAVIGDAERFIDDPGSVLDALLDRADELLP